MCVDTPRIDSQGFRLQYALLGECSDFKFCLADIRHIAYIGIPLLLCFGEAQ
jgi:hypothetical protein